VKIQKVKKSITIIKSIKYNKEKARKIFLAFVILRRSKKY